MKRTRQCVGLSYLYYMGNKPKVQVKSFQPRHTIEGITFPALIQTDKYYLLDINTNRYERLKLKTHKIPNLLLI